MSRVLLFILAAGAVLAAFQIAIVILVIGGLIFRTKETIGLLLLGACLSFFGAHPKIAAGIVFVIVAISMFVRRNNELPEEAPILPEPDK
ncbi:hypothetical protein [Novosphingobium sp. MMS21-SN21R]|uniref:hypothetical protein n=1 Tax=Novosphingobium sp. MMS21-SN21R TaxID=2969298 RepID=UPI002887C929|nr:hypothetical protein [Novosphingobium sp. MMS21-SN21R]MDT0507444.1 hypothetical protein [Novosphingobium sp. MMS21-SN21R]